jgi:uncharacterized membrane-anchored protein
LAGLAWAGFVSSGFGQAPAPSRAEKIAEIKRLAEGLQYRQGQITLKNGLAKINVPPSFRFLNGPDAETVLTKIWGNPPGSNPLGMILAAKNSLLDRDGWAVEITYREEGYIKDDDAGKLDYDKLLKQMQDSAQQENPEREKQGYQPIEIVGWATPPRYDQSSHKMYWAKEISFGSDPEHTLNYDIRMLGRRGVLVLTAIAPMDRLQDVEAATPALLSMVDFQEGHRYVDFNSSTDKVATYGLGALIVGGVLAKAGFFTKILLPLILVGKKFVIIGVVALGAAIKRIFAAITGRREKPPTV